MTKLYTNELYGPYARDHLLAKLRGEGLKKLTINCSRFNDEDSDLHPRFNDEDLKLIFESLIKANSLLSLTIENQKIPQAEALAAFLESPSCSLQSLTITGKHVSLGSSIDANLTPIFESLAKNNSLLHLTIQNQLISQKGLAALCKFLNHRACTLQSLTIKGNYISLGSSIDASSLQKLANSLAKNKSLHSLTLEQCKHVTESENSYTLLPSSKQEQYNQEALSYFAQSLRDNYFITSVSLDYSSEKLCKITQRNRVFAINAFNCIRLGMFLYEEEFNAANSLLSQKWCAPTLENHLDDKTINTIKSKLSNYENYIKTVTTQASYKKLPRLACSLLHITDLSQVFALNPNDKHSMNGFSFRRIFDFTEFTLSGRITRPDKKIISYDDFEDTLRKYIENHEEKLKSKNPIEAEEYDIKTAETALEDFSTHLVSHFFGPKTTTTLPPISSGTAEVFQAAMPTGSSDSAYKKTTNSTTGTNALLPNIKGAGSSDSHISTIETYSSLSSISKLPPVPNSGLLAFGSNTTNLRASFSATNKTTTATTAAYDLKPYSGAAVTLPPITPPKSFSAEQLSTSRKIGSNLTPS